MGGAQRTIAGGGGENGHSAPPKEDLHPPPPGEGVTTQEPCCFCAQTLPLNAGKTFSLSKRVRHEIDRRLFGEMQDFSPFTWSHPKEEQNGSSGQEGRGGRVRGDHSLRISEFLWAHPSSLEPGRSGMGPWSVGLVWLLAVVKHKQTSRTPRPSWRPRLCWQSPGAVLGLSLSLTPRRRHEGLWNAFPGPSFPALPPLRAPLCCFKRNEENVHSRPSRFSVRA